VARAALPLDVDVIDPSLLPTLHRPAPFWHQEVSVVVDALAQTTAAGTGGARWRSSRTAVPARCFP